MGVSLGISTLCVPLSLNTSLRAFVLPMWRETLVSKGRGVFALRELKGSLKQKTVKQVDGEDE